MIFNDENNHEPLLVANALSQTTLTRIEKYVQGMQRSTNDQTDKSVEKRNAKAVWIKRSSITAPIFSDVYESFLIVNKTFSFDIANIEEPLLYAEYEEGGHFTWHTDHWPQSAARRKISCSILLSPSSEYEGGQLEFCPGGPLKNFVRRGTGVFFPAYHAHRVLKVEKGLRRVLVAWIHGRPFC